ncbi:hypothetical protein J7M28_01210 [bacterium]|nr:hypothetical protein [bacterium]
MHIIVRQITELIQIKVARSRETCGYQRVTYVVADETMLGNDGIDRKDNE